MESPRADTHAQDSEYVAMLEHQPAPTDTKATKTQLHQEEALNCPHPSGNVSLVSKTTLTLLSQYALVALVQYFINTTIFPVFYYHLSDDVGLYYAASTLAALPWTVLRVFVGFVSDLLPIQGQRRRPWMFVGLAIMAISLLILGCMSMPGVLEERLEDHHVSSTRSRRYFDEFPEAPKRSKVRAYLIMMTIVASGLTITTAAADGLVTDISRHEPEVTRGRTLLTAYGTRMISQALGVIIFAHAMHGKDEEPMLTKGISFPAMMILLAVLTVGVLVATWFLMEETTSETVSTRSINEWFQGLWDRLQSRSTLQLLVFVILFSILGRVSYYPAEIRMSSAESYTTNAIGYLGMAALVALLALVGLRWNWRFLLGGAMLTAIALDLLIGLTAAWGKLQHEWIVMVLTIMSYVPLGLKIVVPLLAYVELADDGYEGLTFGLLMTVDAIGGRIGGEIAKALRKEFKPTMRSRYDPDESDARWDETYLILLCHGFQVLAVLCVILLPSQTRHLQQLKQLTGRYLPVAVVVLLLCVSGLLWVIIKDLRFVHKRY